MKPFCITITTLWLAVTLSSHSAEQPLMLDEVQASVRTQYPPYLAALIEQDIANGRVRQAQGSFAL
jgi:hypothetical protein